MPPFRRRRCCRPRNTEEVSAALANLPRARQAVTPQGGLTGLVGGATAVSPASIALSLERMNGDRGDRCRTATRDGAQPARRSRRCSSAADEAGFFFPLDISARGSCTIGGNIATNAGGNRVIRYGMTRDLVLGLEAVLADGTVVSSLNKMLKNNAGYDLKQLFIGTEGTLGVVTRAIVRLLPRPGTVSTPFAVVPATRPFSRCCAKRRPIGWQLSSFEAMSRGRAITASSRRKLPHLRRPCR